MKNFKRLCENWDNCSTLSEAIGIDDIATIGLKYYNEEYRIREILKAYPTPQSLKLKLMDVGTPKALEFANTISNDMPQNEYIKLVRQLSGRTLLRWMGNLIGSPFSTIYQMINTINLKNRKPTASEIINDRT